MIIFVSALLREHLSVVPLLGQGGKSGSSDPLDPLDPFASYMSTSYPPSDKVHPNQTNHIHNCLQF